MTVEEARRTFIPTSSANRIIDVDLPNELELNGNLVKIPECLRAKQISNRLTDDGLVQRTAWIKKSLGYILNALRQEDSLTRSAQLGRALTEIDREIATLIRVGVLKNGRGPGAMAFSQANENVPEDAVLISQHTHQALVAYDPRWAKIQDVLAFRFPNLGPRTTQKLRLIINRGEDYAETSLYYRLPELKALLEPVEEEADYTGLPLDAFYFHNRTLREGFEGDGDGDLVYLVGLTYGRPHAQDINLTREPGPIGPDTLERMVTKASRVDMPSVGQWIRRHLDVDFIAKATYAVRWELYKRLRDYKNDSHPMSKAWTDIAPEAIELIEFVMDIRKGEFTDREVRDRIEWVEIRSREIQNAKRNGDWFARTVTARTTDSVPEFLTRFPTLQAYLDHITNPFRLTLTDLLEDPHYV